MLIHLLLLSIYGFMMTLIHLFLVAAEQEDDSYNSAWSIAVKENPISIVLCIVISPGLIFIAVLVVYHTYLCMIEETTNENVKDHFHGVPFTPYSKGSYAKNLCLRIFESIPETLLTPDLRERDKVSVHETKMALERKWF